MGSRDSFTNYPYGNFFFFFSLPLFLVNMPLNCNKKAMGKGGFFRDENRTLNFALCMSKISSR